MPHKDKEKRKKASRESMRKKREGLTSGVNNNGVNIETVPASYVEGLNGRKYEVLPERPRYLTLSDGQVLDRANQPEGTTNEGMQACNEACYNFHPHKNQ